MRVASGIVPVHRRSWHVVHFWFVIVVVARRVIVRLDDALALDKPDRTLNVGLALVVPTKVPS
jgi:hypothetical protein